MFFLRSDVCKYKEMSRFGTIGSSFWELLSERIMQYLCNHSTDSLFRCQKWTPWPLAWICAAPRPNRLSRSDVIRDPSTIFKKNAVSDGAGRVCVFKGDLVGFFLWKWVRKLGNSRWKTYLAQSDDHEAPQAQNSRISPGTTRKFRESVNFSSLRSELPWRDRSATSVVRNWFWAV